MSYTPAPTVNTGGEMGQILDHLVCSDSRKIRLGDGRAALDLHSKVCEKLERVERALAREQLRGDALELVLTSIRNNVDGAIRAHTRSEENA